MPCLINVIFLCGSIYTDSVWAMPGEMDASQPKCPPEKKL